VLLGQPVTVTYQVTLTASYGGFTLTNAARLDDGFGQVVRRQAATLVLARQYFPLVWKPTKDE
jgi:hypothetical protein